MKKDFLRRGFATQILAPARETCSCGARLVVRLKNCETLLFGKAGWAESLALTSSAGPFLLRLPSSDRLLSEAFQFSAFHFLPLPDKAATPAVFDYLFDREKNFNYVLKRAEGFSKEELLDGKKRAEEIFERGIFVFSGSPSGWPSDLLRLSSALLPPDKRPRELLELPKISSEEPPTVLLSGYGGSALRLFLLLASEKSPAVCRKSALRKISSDLNQLERVGEKISTLSGTEVSQTEELLSAGIFARISQAKAAMETGEPRKAVLALFSGFFGLKKYLRSGGRNRAAAESAFLRLSSALSPLAPAVSEKLLSGRRAPPEPLEETTPSSLPKELFIEGVISDIRRAESFLEKKPETGRILLAEKWKYDFFSSVDYAVRDGLDPTAFSRAFSNRGRREAEFVKRFFSGKGRWKPNLSPQIFSQEDELQALLGARDAICKRTGILQLEIGKSDDLIVTTAFEREKIGNARPWKPAIIMQ